MDNTPEEITYEQLQKAIEFAVWLELNGYRIKGWDDTQRNNIYQQFLQSLLPKEE